MGKTNDDDKPLHVRELADGGAVIEDPVAEQLDGHRDDGGALDGDADGNDASLAAGTTEEGAATDHPDDAEALAGATNDAEREAIRARRREERRAKKENAKAREKWFQDQLAARDRLIAELNQRVSGVDQRLAQADLAQLDALQRRAAGAVEYYKGLVAEATKKQDGTAVAEATEKMVLAREEANRLASVRQQITQQSSSQGNPTLNPQAMELAKNWVSRNPWYKPSGGDFESDLVLALDRQLEREGFDATQPAYWNELDKRVAKSLPHRAGSGYTRRDSQNQEPSSNGRSPVAGGARNSGANGSSTQRPGTYTLSAERVQALKDAGLWDDPKARSDAIRRYRDYDRQQAGNRS